MVSGEEVLTKLRGKARPDQLAGMARYGMVAERGLDVSVPDMRRVAKELGNDHTLALGLWQTGIPEAKIVAAMIGEPDRLTEKQMENWVKEIDS